MAYLGARLSHGVAEDPVNIVVEVSATKLELQRLAKIEARATAKDKRRAFWNSFSSDVGSIVGGALNSAKNKIVPQPTVEVEKIVTVEKPVMVETIKEVHIPLVIKEAPESSFFDDTVPEAWVSEVSESAKPE